ncbi:hypothetical protein [Anaerocellum danielii]|uniref:Antitoxin Xre/MbcA/ParS-like toxin-binding domain-containing protein n=1 Tax=Anaerocellum danielii TaxID=1387557 RepID=A0ABZ0TZ19_9FIRM|nr:hypothetical protein [Caldicellulosiruptor danielii]WPX08709.1 hypothetical protein SOJ16_002618 [Caldicellulosiruptor danielii]
MYRIFCESYYNYLKNFENKEAKDEYRYKIAGVFELIANPQRFYEEKSKNSDAYQNLCDLLHYMKENIHRYPKFKAFLWTLESRQIEPVYFGKTPQNVLVDQAKLANMFLNLMYWE